MLWSLDTEATGLDVYHSCKPFFITMCSESNEQLFWQWEVDPKTRQPKIPKADIDEVRQAIIEASELVLHNSKFDYAALRSVDPHILDGWNWDNVHDTLIAGHVVSSSTPHNLTDMTKQYLKINIGKYEKTLNEYVQAARRFARSKLPDWRIARKGLKDLPSAKEESWKADMWLPRAVALHMDYADSHPWYTALSEYSNHDSAVTTPLWLHLRNIMEKKDLWDIYYKVRRKAMPIAAEMERRGVTYSDERLRKLRSEYLNESEKAGSICVRIAKNFIAPCPDCDKPKSINKDIAPGDPAKLTGLRQIKCETCKGTKESPYVLKLPKVGNNDNLRNFVYDHMKLTVGKRSQKTGNPSLDSDVLKSFLTQLPEKGREYLFCKSLLNKRKRDTAITYMDGYKRFGIPLPIFNESDQQLWYILHPSLNPTGTGTLRWSSSNPNEQNISKQEGFNLRFAFGPAPGREWWSLDGKNLELRLPVYEAQEIEMMALFERPKDPPYFGSNHLLISHILHPAMFDDCFSCLRCAREIKSPSSAHNEEGFCECTSKSPLLDGRVFKKRYESTWYKWIKNGNFAIQYGAQEATADRAYHLNGAYRIIKQRFRNMEALNQSCIQHANKYGFVYTMPDRRINPNHGYPLLCTRNEYNKVLPTVPLNYHIQGTAMWWMQMAMIPCHDYLETLNQQCGKRDEYFITMQVHDELVFDFPKSIQPTTVVNLKHDRSNEVIRIDRQTEWGNPFIVGKDGTRSEVIEKYSKWIKDQPNLMKKLKRLAGRKLGCHCKPQACHGDVLAKMAGDGYGNLPKVQHLQKLMEENGPALIPSIPTPVSIEYHPVSWDKGMSL